jgi:glycosyltransferase involved in cell wall biosynthesis
MRVALLSYNARAGDAIGNQIAEKLAFFLERGADVRLFVESANRLHPAVEPYCQGLNAAQADGEEWRFLSSADLIVVEYGQYYSLLGLLPLLAGGKPRILFDYHGVTPGDLWGSHNREAIDQGSRQRGIVWCADAALVHSQFTGQELYHATHFPPERLFTLDHPVDTQKYGPGVPCHYFHQQLGLEPAATILLFVGRLAPNKRVGVLVEALAHLRDVTPPIHAVIVGDIRDVYHAEAERCRERAAALGIGERLHFLGHVSQERLLDAYRAANVFVMPSRHEGFCIPIVEALACGLPVVAAQAGALPETLGDAGLTFLPDDAEDLARQVGRVLAPSLERGRLARKVAVVSFRFGLEFVGGAETSLRRIAITLQEAGREVEVFTTCTQSESNWSNALPEGTTDVAGIPVHRFRIDPHDRARHLESVRVILQSEGQISSEAERAYLEHSVHSARLLDALRNRIDEFEAVFVGPYLFGLSFDVARAFPAHTILVPCFHAEPVARLRLWRSAYPHVGSILYHSNEEKLFAETVLGMNHPRSACLGTFVDSSHQGDAERGRARVATHRPYIVYCGRYSVQKNVPLILDYAKRYHEAHADRFMFLFMGQGEVAIPKQPWTCDLGFVDEEFKTDVMAGAAALVQLSHYESLSLVALEAWAQGVPVIAARACAVLTGHLSRCGGGKVVASYEEFAAALDELWEEPQTWQRRGKQGHAYVQSSFGSATAFKQCLLEAMEALSAPLAESMRRRGLSRAAIHDRVPWREQFAALVERVLDMPSRVGCERVEVHARAEERRVLPGSGMVLVPVRIANCGTAAVVHEGPARMVLRTQVFYDTGLPVAGLELDTPLPGLLMPGQEVSAILRVPVPETLGKFLVRMWTAGPARKPSAPAAPVSQFWLLVEESGPLANLSCCGSILETVRARLVEADRQSVLPDDYLDVTEGFFAHWKRWLKRKVLGNFKHAYVDVLSRQQSAFNRHMLAAVHELAECCAMLDHVRATMKEEIELPGIQPIDRPVRENGVVFLRESIERTVPERRAESQRSPHITDYRQ